ncbi:ubiquitin-activating E1 FCCH domain-containing protein [Devosia aurantiaca]|uniref:Pilus assembly protein TadG n=1 Tax=Devosia aurantiaca TaxID=2714858 RepID=A0A6M1SJP3_9HYPH|nr:ubiquitin-activating E1 FCCH domain-containing protein [Devosia aurantiaca]NGP17360.1 pilus assembly protein TadG [Devosia aurantiaca]
MSVKVDRITIEPESGRLLLGGQFVLPTSFVSLVGVNQLSASFTSEAMQGSVNMEVSLALDITGSMKGTRITDLQKASYELIDTILANNSGDTTAKIALVPYAQSVNAGAYAETLRGPIRQQRTIQAINWSTGTAKVITSIERTNLATVNAVNHGFQVNDWVYISNVVGMTQVNSKAFKVSSIAAGSFTLTGVNATSYTRGTGGTVIKCLAANCDPVITSNGHGYAEGEQIIITGALGLTDLNNKTFNISSVTANSFVLANATFNRLNLYIANSGRFYCDWQTAAVGCTQYTFTNVNGASRTNAVTSCVTDRIAPINDRKPSTTFASRNYPEPNNGCIANSVVPLTSDAGVLDAAIGDLEASGSTAGALGILWSWYMLAPNFGEVWPASRPAPYNEDDLLKAVIIMTDGEFNTVHCNGVVARNSTSGSSIYSYGNADYINCAAPNGDAYTQARAYCNAMKSGTGIVVYTVGFGISKGSTAANLLETCATSTANAFLAENGADLITAFRQIARNISALRLTL